MLRERGLTLGKVVNGILVVLILIGLCYAIGRLFSENEQHHRESEVLIEEFSQKLKQENTLNVELISELLEKKNTQELERLKKENDELKRLVTSLGDKFQKSATEQQQRLQTLFDQQLKKEGQQFSQLADLISSSSQSSSLGSIERSHPNQPTDRVLRPFGKRAITVTPGSFFSKQLISDTIPEEVLAAKRVKEDDKSFFAFYGQLSLGQDPILDYLFAPGSDEERIRGLFKSIFKETSKNAALMKLDPIVLDIGANMGYYSLLTVVFGFPVIAFEPQPHCHLFLKTASVLNGFEDKVTIVSALVGNDPNMSMMAEHRTGCWGTWPQTEENTASKVPEKYRRTPVPVGEVGVDELLDELYTQKGREIPVIPLMKVDTEGFEFQVLQSARKLLASKKVKNLVIELNTIGYGRSKTNPAIAKEMLLWLREIGYGMQCMGDNGNEYFTTKNPVDKDNLLARAKTLTVDDPYSTDCWLYLTN